MLAEWKEGEVILTMPAKEEHQRVVTLLVTLLNLFIGLRQAGVVLEAPFEVRLGPDGPSREPDILFVASSNLGRLSRDRLVGGPDLAVEVISDDSVGRDRGDKFYEYQDAGVREYWIVDPRPRRHRLDAFALDEQGVYGPLLPDDAGRVRSRILPGFWVHPEWLWEEPALSPLPLLAEMLGLPSETLAAFASQ
jgi:Uma2 family endonuclease